MIYGVMGKRTAGSQYMLLANNLIEKIGSGVYPPGSLLPSETELCGQFNVSRITVRSALKELETKGLVSRRAGIGTRVEAPREQPAFTHLGASVDDVLRFTKGVPVKVLSRGEVIADAGLARELELPEGQRFVRFETVRQKRGCPPLVYSEHFVPALLAPSSDELDGLQVSIAQWLADRHGDQVFTISQQFAAVTLRKAEAEHLQVSRGAPALRSARWYFGRNDILLLASVSLFPGSQYTFKSMLRRAA
jgi:DNA-binding GntR family transcriptional regulator